MLAGRVHSVVCPPQHEPIEAKTTKPVRILSDESDGRTFEIVLELINQLFPSGSVIRETLDRAGS
jgi:hypothetical protein